LALRLATLAVLTLVLLAASAGADPAGSDFTITPNNPPNVDQEATFTFVPGPALAGDAVVQWDIAGDSAFEETGTEVAHTYESAGPATVRMRVTDDDGQQDFEKTFTVNGAPLVEFDFNPISALPGVEVWFDQVVTDPEGDTVALAWDFGDGATASGEDPRHTYATPGTRVVKLTATDEHGAVTEESRQLTVQDPAGPTASFDFSPAVPSVNQVLTLTDTSTPSSGSIETALWDLDNDGEFDDSPAGWSFSTPGIHEVSLRVSQTNGNQAVAEHSIRVNAPPTAAFVWSPLTPAANQPVDLISTSTDAEGALSSQAWELDGDDDFNDATGPNATQAFPAGTRTVKLRVTDSDGVVSTVSHQLTVLDQPTAAFTVSPAVPLVGEVLAVTDQSTASSGVITARQWDLDDDGAFDDSPAGWAFSTAGNHRVALKVTQSNGTTAFTERVLRVNAPPTAAFVLSPPSPVAGQATDLVSISTDPEGALGAHAWDLDGDGAFDDASGPGVRHAFPHAGTYDVGLEVTDSDGVARTVRRTVSVSQPAAAVPGFITPFPVVRLAGKVLPRGALVKLLVVRAPRGARMRVTCQGKGCPVRGVRRTSQGGSARFAQFQHRLRAGIRLEIFVRTPKAIGKYTRFLIRAGAPPTRTDRCLFPGVPDPRACP
jgi:PKD repeat protein